MNNQINSSISNSEIESKIESENESIDQFYLSKKEKDIIQGLNTKANQSIEDSRFENQTIQNTFIKWSQVMSDTFKDIVDLMSNDNQENPWFVTTKKQKKEKFKINSVDKNNNVKEKDDNNWWKFYVDKINSFIKVITKEERLIYIGITLLIFSIIFNFISSL